MACGQLKEFTFDSCSGNIGGIKRVWLAEYDPTYVISSTTVDDIEQIVKVTNSGGTDIEWVEFQLKKNSANAESAYQVGDGGSVFCQTTLAMTFNKQDAGKRMAIQSLALNELYAIYEDANGNRWFLGKDNPVTLSEGGGSTGQQKTDLNSYNVSLVDDSMELPLAVQQNYPVSGGNVPA
jgi:hypothetical protein